MGSIMNLWVGYQMKLNQPIDRMWFGTFHSLSAKVLRSNCNLIGLKSNFIIIDTDDQLKLIKQVLA